MIRQFDNARFGVKWQLNNVFEELVSFHLYTLSFIVSSEFLGKIPSW